MNPIGVSKVDQRSSRLSETSELLPNVVRTLLLNGYDIDSFERPALGASILRVRRRDLLGAEAKMTLLLANRISKALHERLLGEARRYNSTPIIIWTDEPQQLPSETHQHKLVQFYELLGGEVRTSRVSDPQLKEHMNELGHNRLPVQLSGKPDDLLEVYSQECLAFLLECPVRRYGQERRFEPLPDGLALGRKQLNIFFDAKAYGEAFHPTADDMRRFASYVRDFNDRYKSYVGPMSMFIVISGAFSSDQQAVQDKVNELSIECATPMIFLKASDLADAVWLVRTKPNCRAAINWRRVFVAGMFDLSKLKKELVRVEKDCIVH